MATNDNFIKINKGIFKGDNGAEQAFQNEALLMIMIRQDAIVNSMDDAQKARYYENLGDFRDTSGEFRNQALDLFIQIKTILGKDVSLLESLKDETTLDNE